MRLGAAFVPVRKSGKLPGECVQALYEKEYGTVRATPAEDRHVLNVPLNPQFQDTFEMQIDSMKEGQNVIVVDDLIATGVFLLVHMHIVYLFSDLI